MGDRERRQERENERERSLLLNASVLEYPHTKLQLSSLATRGRGGAAEWWGGEAKREERGVGRKKRKETGKDEEGWEGREGGGV